jgi:hypothetical protein
VILQHAVPESLVAFVTSLESRLAVLLEAKVCFKQVTKVSMPIAQPRRQEKSTLVLFSQRGLYCMLFYEMRLITRSLKPWVVHLYLVSLVLIFPCRSPWVSRVLQWVTQWHEGYEGSISTQEEVELMVSKLLALYSTAELGSQPNAKVRVIISLFRGYEADPE